MQVRIPGLKPCAGKCNFSYLNRTDDPNYFLGRQSACVATSKDGLQEESKELGHEIHRRRKKQFLSRC